MNIERRLEALSPPCWAQIIMGGTSSAASWWGDAPPFRPAWWQWPWDWAWARGGRRRLPGLAGRGPDAHGRRPLFLPSILTALLAVTLLGPGQKSILVAVALANIPIFARLTRSQFLSIREREHVLAARAMGYATPASSSATSFPTACPPSWSRPASTSPPPSWLKHPELSGPRHPTSRRQLGENAQGEPRALPVPPLPPSSPAWPSPSPSGLQPPGRQLARQRGRFSLSQSATSGTFLPVAGHRAACPSSCPAVNFLCHTTSKKSWLPALFQYPLRLGGPTGPVCSR